MGALVGLLAAPALGAPAGGPYPVGNGFTGYQADLTAPTSTPPGANNFSCRPSAAHPDPVVLVHGTFLNMATSWQALSPILANEGYCVFAFNYGATYATTLSGDREFGLGPVPQAARQLSFFVAQVRKATGASKVDLVGHSQGGMMPRYYMRFLGGAAKVDRLVALAPSNHGTTADGLFALINAASAFGAPKPLTLAGCPACDQQERGSAFLTHLNAGGDTVPGVRYTVIETDHDEVVTPYQSAFLAGPHVRNITLQNQCPADLTDHLGITYDSAALQDVVSALGPDNSSFRPVCGLALPLVGG